MNSNQLALLEQMALGRRPAAAAAVLGLNARTCQKWAREPIFQSALREAIADRMDSAITGLIGGTAVAIETLTSICEDRDIAPAVRVSAAKIIVEQALRNADLVQRQRMEAFIDLRALPDEELERLAAGATVSLESIIDTLLKHPDFDPQVIAGLLRDRFAK